MVKNPPSMQETEVQPLGGEDPLEKGMVTWRILAWRIPWTEEPCRLQPMGSQFYGQRSLADCNPWGLKELDTTKQVTFYCFLIFSILNICMCVYIVVIQSPSNVCLFVTPWTVACQTPLSLGFSKQEYWSVLPFASSGDLPKPGIKPVSPALVCRFFIAELPERPVYICIYKILYICYFLTLPLYYKFHLGKNLSILIICDILTPRRNFDIYYYYKYLNSIFK